MHPSAYHCGAQRHGESNAQMRQMPAFSAKMLVALLESKLCESESVQPGRSSRTIHPVRSAFPQHIFALFNTNDFFASILHYLSSSRRPGPLMRGLPSARRKAGAGQVGMREKRTINPGLFLNGVPIFTAGPRLCCGRDGWREGGGRATESRKHK